MIYGNVYRELKLRRGDEVHALCGGEFVVTRAGVFPARMTISEKSPFEKSYGGEAVDRWPLEALAPTSTPRKPSAYPHQTPLMKAGRMVGYGINSIVD